MIHNDLTNDASASRVKYGTSDSIQNSPRCHLDQVDPLVMKAYRYVLKLLCVNEIYENIPVRSQKKETMPVWFGISKTY